MTKKVFVVVRYGGRIKRVEKIDYKKRVAILPLSEHPTRVWSIPFEAIEYIFEEIPKEEK